MKHLFLSALLFALCPLSHAATKPNIITILVDDMGFSDIGCYGSEIPTPNIDALAAGGVKFRQFYNNARCCPTRASLLTGLYPHQAGIGHMAGKDTGLAGYRGQLREDCLTMAQWLQPAGYFTAMVGKWHVGAEAGSNPWERGFQRSLNSALGGFYLPDSAKANLFEDGKPIPSRGGSLPQDWYSSDLFAQTLLRYSDEAKAAGQPFFFYLPFVAPHFPLQARAEDIAKFRGSYKRGWGALRDERHTRQIELGLIDAAWKKSPRPPEIKLWRDHTPEEQDRFDHLMAVYAAVVHGMDRAVGTLVSGLRQRGVLDDTLILFMSDNGGNAESGPAGRSMGDPTQADSTWFCGESWAFLQNTPFRRYKHYTHEGGISTPLIAHWPSGITKRGWVNEPAHVIDIAATLADITGAAYPKEHSGKAITPLQGQSLKPLLTTTAESLPPRPLFWEHEGNAAVRLGDSKLVRKGSDGPWELYDLKTDRTEMNDLAAGQATKVKELTTLWQQWAQTTDVLPQPPLSAGEGGSGKAKKGKGKGKAKSQAPTSTAAVPIADTSALFAPTPAAAADARIPMPPAALPKVEKLAVLELKNEIPTHFRFKPRKNETIPQSQTRFTTSNGQRSYELVATVLGPNQGRRMTFKNELFLLDEKRLGYRWHKGETSAEPNRVTMTGSTGLWCVFPPVAEFDEAKRPVLRDLDAILMRHENVRYQIHNLHHSDPAYDVNKWDFVYDFDIKGLGEIIVALAGDMKGPDRGVVATQTAPIDPTIITDRFGNRFRYESYTPQKGGGHFYLVRQVDEQGRIITRPQQIPAQTDILPIIRHVMACAHRGDDDSSNDRDHETLPTKYTLGPMLLGSEVWDQTRGYILMDRSVDMECVLKR